MNKRNCNRFIASILRFKPIDTRVVRGYLLPLDFWCLFMVSFPVKFNFLQKQQWSMITADIFPLFLFEYYRLIIPCLITKEKEKKRKVEIKMFIFIMLINSWLKHKTGIVNHIFFFCFFVDFIKWWTKLTVLRYSSIFNFIFLKKEEYFITW